MERHSEDLVVDNKEIGLEVNAENTRYMVMSQELNAGKKIQYIE
jgi:hypothetical protein